MTLNLINDAWIPVLRADGSRTIIAPWQMAETGIVRPDWPRPDFNIACYEFLIGLVFLADPPRDIEDWDDRSAPDPVRLKEKLAPFAPAFELLGDGPRFLQDMEHLDGAPNPIDSLFIDSAGANTAKNNADLMVHRSRYPALDPAMATMALYTFQGFAPSGGAGNRTSMRGGGPMVTLVDPQRGLCRWSGPMCRQALLGASTSCRGCARRVCLTKDWKPSRRLAGFLALRRFLGCHGVCALSRIRVW